jgi:hypothetical protein
MTKPVIDEKELMLIAQSMLSDQDIANYYDVDIQDLRLHFGNKIDKGRAKGKVWLLQQQFQLAKDGDIEMIKQLAKTYL